MSTDNPYPPQPPAGPPHPGYPGGVPSAPQSGVPQQPSQPYPSQQPYAPQQPNVAPSPQTGVPQSGAPQQPYPSQQPYVPQQPNVAPSPHPGVPQSGVPQGGASLPPSQPYPPTSGQPGVHPSAPLSQYPQPTSPAARLTAGFPPGNYPPVPGTAPDAGAQPPKKKLLLPILIGALAVLLIGGGVAFAGLTLGWFGGGGGKQPYEVLPGTASIYGQVDLNPSTDQKVAAFNFFKELPELSNADANSLDVKKTIWDAVSKTSSMNGIDYDTDLKPWLGNRLGVAVLPKSSGNTVSVIAVQVTDEGVAKDKLPSVLTKIDSTLTLVTVKDGYAILTEVDVVDTVKTALDGDTLAKNANFSSDIKALGNTGWAAGWVDIKAASQDYSSSGVDVSSVTGRATYALRFSGTTLELAGLVTGADSKSVPAANGGTDLGDLPADTGFAASIQGGAAWANSNWSLIQKALSSYSSYYSSITQEQVAAVLGNQATLAVSGDVLKSYGSYSSGSTPEMGFKVNTDNPSVLQQMLGSSSYKTSVVGNVVTIATTDSYLAKLANNSGDKLSSSANFTAVVPDYSKASVAAYLDLSALSSLWDKMSTASKYTSFLKALTAVGMSTTPTSDGATWSLRVARS